MGRKPRFEVGPAHSPRFVPCMVEQSGFGIPKCRIYPFNLDCEIFDDFTLIDILSIEGGERSLHIDSIQPDLPRIDLLVPVDPAARPRLADQLFAKDVGRLDEPPFSGFLMQEKKIPPGIDHIEVVLARSIVLDRPVLSDERVIHRIRPIEEGCLSIVLTHLQDCGDDQSMLIMPPHLSRLVPIDDTFSHFQGVVLRHNPIPRRMSLTESVRLIRCISQFKRLFSFMDATPASFHACPPSFLNSSSQAFQFARFSVRLPVMNSLSDCS
ncbi:MAG: hypothetical protein BWY50_00146 [Spirochaetes bacterium ADurb.Bin315]|nr:MAG: hypothetical protein BWY50_00146 [Spirochaetes bacterium ADurb.Bin315]